MNRKISAKAIQRGLLMGALFFSAAAASAQTQVTFQVDMTAQVIAGTFTNGTAVTASGTFNGWGQFTLTNNSASANTNLFTGTTDDTTDPIGTVLIYKYVAGGTYESTADGDNRCAQLPAAGGNLLLPVSFYDDAGPSVTVNVTFQVDMSEQINIGTFDTNTGSSVQVNGGFNGWGANATDTLTNDPTILTTNATGIVSSNVYVGTFAITGATNATEEYKYVEQPGPAYESPSTTDSDFDNSENRFFINTTETLPIVSFSDKPLVVSVTNIITFECDMTALIEVGAFTTNQTLTLAGDFNGWSTTAQPMSNNPAASNPDLYSTMVTIVDVPGAEHYFKFVENGTYESLANNRDLFLLQTNGSFTYGPVYFNNQVPEPFDFVYATNCMVTFTVSMTNANGTGITGTGAGGTFTYDTNNPTSDTVWINGLDGGVNNSFWTWAEAPFPGGAAGYQMTQIPNTSLFTITLPVNKGQSADLIYKYSIDGYDDEAGFADNHERWIRSQPNYTMPVDTYASQGASTQTEIAFGNLAATASTNNQIQVSWLGRPGVELQTTPSLSPAVWTSQPLTDGTNLMVAPGGIATTNYTIGAGNLFYRLVGPQ
jgi:hypothetical protein